MRSKEIRADAKLKSLPQEELEVLWAYRYPVEGQKKMTYKKILAQIPLRYGFDVSLSTLSKFYSWLRLKKRMDAAADRAQQAKLELAKDPDISPEDLERVAQVVFTNESLETGDVKAYVQLAKLRLQARALDHDARRIAILETKAKQAEEAEGIATDSKLTAAEKEARLKRIFGMG